MKDMDIESVEAFQEAFLERMRSVASAELEALGKGVFNGDIQHKIEEVAADAAAPFRKESF